ncbi:hypothetical protein [Paeniglutamicibacter cryotolerans]|uniref:DUF4352 domain-containing protein n=1 Tax=Paeniglutamicibacter cryotolerans TaxID=670079 RepID=A0A839QKT6_9MICC|nr:hypothetical protein [Paeniglutamicibacter cryotolerans]MBB2997018.1 hypothetical protein [Paeniglutamicibacter cryotolerans]
MHEKARITLLSVVCVVAVGLGFGIPAAKGTMFQLPAELQAGSDTAVQDPISGKKVVTDKHDNVAKKRGETAGLVDEHDGKTYFTFEVLSAKTVSSCTPRVGVGMLKPENGYFLVVDVKASMAASISQQVGGSSVDIFMPVIAEAFSVLSPTGKIQREVASAAAFGCLTEKELAPPLISPGEKLRGKVVLDVPFDDGRVVFDPEENGGWSWPLGE